MRQLNVLWETIMWYEGYMQVFENAKSLGDLTVTQNILPETHFTN